LMAALNTDDDGKVSIEDFLSQLFAESKESKAGQTSSGTRRGPPYVIAVCGTTCCGKTTIACSLAEGLNKIDKPPEPPAGVPEKPALTRSVTSRALIRAISSAKLARSISAPIKVSRDVAYDEAERQEYEASEAIHGDDFFVFDQYCTDSCPTKQVGTHVWKDWESISAIDWEELVDGVEKAKVDPTCPKYIVVEGFLLLAKPESRALFDAVVEVPISKEECWRRRRGRAEGMSHLPPGFSTSEEEKNYEILETYVRSDADRDAMHAEAKKRYPEEGELAWLRMYFEEVVWPATLAQADESAELERSGLPVLRIDAGAPPGKEEWKKANIPRAFEFCTKAFAS